MEKGGIKTVIRIQGNDYSITSSEPDEFVQRVAYYINKKFDEVSERNKKLSTNLIATFAAINIAEECLKEADENKKLTARLESLLKTEEKKSAELDMFRRRISAYENEIQELKIKIAKLEK